ncbi:D-Tyr-tRNAtyr deacylase [Paenibacillus sp. UMB4589-SE434]|uniref:D-Tyr-tRNAtyr deacylase n=1 Tax=Paenibacillus sp. UMB4589-SE434 TaxID=3046314 RepID=UPI00254A9FB9|nr:D-Tyr-tRNAtyr deacylase [Paenibacillus sp. UMB4589-SE434]MDK8181201.1 D-Tyr-tRNAtyr deacylase [Paenibacillus sp. UMB4589-SE434]
MTSTSSSIYIEAVFKHAVDIDLELRRVTVFGGLMIRNLSREAVEHPQLVLHITPIRATLSGKILSPELVQTFAVYTKGGKQTGWKFSDPDWIKQSKRNGEYRIESIEPLTLRPGKWTELKDWQVEYDFEHISEPLHIQGWVEVNDQRHSVINPISLTCGP